ncbi:thyrotroph embryonic factor isoform X2 [Centruroides vittatus]|uniref:thyrotroph embryonic factor isoform X2 n=1 Tax=Centruroides vittatus TaxID=120091 RepID=UPI0035106DE1
MLFIGANVKADDRTHNKADDICISEEPLRVANKAMDEAHLDLDVHVGVTLRSLLENRELLNPPDSYIRAAKRSEKEDKEGENGNFDGCSAFLGPTLWDKTLTDFKLEYVDLDEFLCENGMPAEEGQKVDHNHMTRQQQQQTDPNQNPHPHSHLHPHHHHHHHHHHNVPAQYNREELEEQEKQVGENVNKNQETDQNGVPVECKFTPDDLALATIPGHNNFDPTLHSFSEDELKPQPMVKKSKKRFVPDNLKDEKYWMRRHKNNIAAKRSREARRVKENQIVLRASYLEKENHVLRDELEKLRGENKMLRQCLKKYEQ